MTHRLKLIKKMEAVEWTRKPQMGKIDRIKVSGTHVLKHRTRINVVASSVQEAKAPVAKFERDIA